MPDLAALLTVAVGWLALGWLSAIAWPGASTWWARWSLRLLIGAWLVGLAQLLLALADIGFSNAIPVLVLAALGALGLRLAAAAPPHAQRVTSERREHLGWLLLAAVLLAATIRSWLVPESGWDAFSHWGLKAQAYALHGTIVDTHTTHEYYPPLVPLLEAWLYLHRGGPAIDVGKTVWPLVGSAFAVCLAWHLRLSLRTTWLAPYLATLVVLGATQLLESYWTGQADLALTAYLTLASLAAFQLLRQPDRSWLIQVGAFGAAAALSKYEGLPRVGVVVLALLLESILSQRRQAVLPAVSLLASAALGLVPWLIYRSVHGIQVTSEHVNAFRPAAIVSVLTATATSLAGVRTGGGILAASLAWLAVGRTLLTPPLRLLTLIVLGQLGATLLAFLISQTAPELQAQTSATRLFQQFMPLALFVAAVGLDCALSPSQRSRDL